MEDIKGRVNPPKIPTILCTRRFCSVSWNQLPDVSLLGSRFFEAQFKVSSVVTRRDKNSRATVGVLEEVFIQTSRGGGTAGDTSPLNEVSSLLCAFQAGGTKVNVSQESVH